VHLGVYETLLLRFVCVSFQPFYCSLGSDLRIIPVWRGNLPRGNLPFILRFKVGFLFVFLFTFVVSILICFVFQLWCLLSVVFDAYAQTSYDYEVSR